MGLAWVEIIKILLCTGYNIRLTVIPYSKTRQSKGFP